MVTVRDTGPGMLAGAEETVFEPFYTTKKDGMGMGLSIVRTIIESHGGAITAGQSRLRRRRIRVHAATRRGQRLNPTKPPAVGGRLRSFLSYRSPTRRRHSE